MRVGLPLTLLLMMSLMFLALPAAAAKRAGSVPEASRQLVLVLTPDAEAITGSLGRFERASAEADWEPVGPSWPIVVGRTGLASGLGLHPRAVEGLEGAFAALRDRWRLPQPAP